MPPMPLRLTRRPGSPFYWITGTVRGRRVRESAGTDDPRLADEFRATREAQLYRAAVHGGREPVTVAAAAESYLVHAGPHSPATLARLRRLVLAIGAKALVTEIDQGRIDQLATKLLRPGSAQSTRLREVTTPIRAILTHAARRGWCDLPMLEAPKPPPPRTEWLRPAEADALIEAAAPHLRPLLTFLIATGARLGEALALAWPDVDLPHARATLRDTKSGADRHLDLCPRALAALQSQPHRIGTVFRTRAGHAYRPKTVQGGGQIKTAWATALRTAGLAGRPITPHTCRHTWATWHAAIHRDPLLLRHEGGWSSLAMVQRYAHLAPRTMVAEMVAWRESDRHNPGTQAANDAKVA
jgi:integrase